MIKKPITLSIRNKGDLLKVPQKFRGIVGRQEIGLCLIVIDGDVHDVWTSKDMDKLLSKVRMKEGQDYAVLVSGVTIEAERVILSKGLKLIRISDFYWTDRSYNGREESSHRVLEIIRDQTFQKKQKDLESTQ
jgi:hypothetical protein